MAWHQMASSVMRLLLDGLLKVGVWPRPAHQAADFRHSFFSS